MAGTDEIGHVEIGAVVLPRHRDDELGMALPKFRQGLLARLFFAARSAGLEKVALTLGRQIGTVEQGADGRGRYVI
jgi:hypothetical protein